MCQACPSPDELRAREEGSPFTATILAWLSCLSFNAVLLARLETPGIQIDLAFGILKSERSSFLGGWVGRWSQAIFLSVGSCCFALGHCRRG